LLDDSESEEESLPDEEPLPELELPDPLEEELSPLLDPELDPELEPDDEEEEAYFLAFGRLLVTCLGGTFFTVEGVYFGV